MNGAQRTGPGGRGLIPGLGTPHPIGAGLPAVYGEDDLVQRITAALDQVLAPVLCTLDNLPAYFDPALAPADFVDYLASWVGGDHPGERSREAVSQTAQSYGLRGTRAGLAAEVRLAFGVEPEIEESGGAAWSAVSGAPLPGDGSPQLLVRLRVPERASVDRAAVAALVSANCPAHLVPEVEIVTLHQLSGGVEDGHGDL